MRDISSYRTLKKTPVSNETLNELKELSTRLQKEIEFDNKRIINRIYYWIGKKVLKNEND